MPKLFYNFIEIALRHRCPPVNLLHIFRTPFYKYISGGLLLELHGLQEIPRHVIISFYHDNVKTCFQNLRYSR